MLRENLRANGPAAIARDQEGDPRPLAIEWLVMCLLVTGFASGPLKLLGHTWIGYLLPDMLALVALVMVFGNRLARRAPMLSASPLSVPILLLAGVCSLELVNPDAPFIRSVLGLRIWLLYLSFYFVGYYSFRSIRQLKRLYVLLLSLGCLTAAYGIYQWRAGPQEFADWSDYYGRYAGLAWIGRTGAVFRAFSTFSSAGIFGANMGYIMLLASSIAASSAVRTRWRVAAGGAFALMGAGIAASGSRSPVALLILAAGVTAVLIPGVRTKLRIGVTVAVVGTLSVLLVLSFLGAVVSERFLTILDPSQFFWKWFIPLTIGFRVAAHAPFGVGLGYTAGVPRFMATAALRDLPSLSIDSGYGSAAAELGFVGLVVFVYFALKVGVEGFRYWRKIPVGPLRDLLLGPALLAVTFPMVSVIAQPQASVPNGIYFWLLVGMVMKAKQLTPPAASPAEPPPANLPRT